MKKWLKNYFVSVCDEPIHKNVLTLVLIIAAVYICDYFYKPAHPLSRAEIGSIITLSFCFLIIVLRAVMIYAITKKYITKPEKRLSSDKNDYNYYGVLVTNKGERIIIDKAPVWGKGTIFYCRIPNLLLWQNRILEFNSSVTGKTEGYAATVNLKITIKFKWDIDKIEVFQALARNNAFGKGLFDIDIYLQNIFQYHIALRVQERINEEVRRFMKREIMRGQMVREIMSDISFPLIIHSDISGIENIIISLAHPERSETSPTNLIDEIDTKNINVAEN